MRKRFTLISTAVVLLIALILPASTAAASYGKIVNTRTTCTQGGNRVNATFKLTKYSGFYASRLEISAWGQGLYGNRWRNEYFLGTYYYNANTSGQAWMTQGFYYVDNAAGSSRIRAKGKIKDGSYVIARGASNSGYCG